MNAMVKQAVRALIRVLPPSVKTRLYRRRRAAARRRFLDARPSLEDAGWSLPRSAVPVADEPIFVLAAGWRSGSTLLQRMVTEAGALVWGEPYSPAGLVQAFSATLGRLVAGPPLREFIVDGAVVRDQPLWLRDQPNLYPPLEDFVDAQRAWFRRLFAEPASRLGYERWGLRETRLDAEHATYLRLLFPRARIVLLYRNPYDSWASLRRYSWIASTPDEVIVTARSFGRHWTRLVDGFSCRFEMLGAHLVSYEAICSDPGARAALADYLGVRFGSAAVAHQGWSKQGPLPRRELRALSRVVMPAAARLGYDGPTATVNSPR
jgi:hypothetical protein